MDKTKRFSQAKLEDDPLWREVCDIAELVYSKLTELPEDERWDTENKLRHAANDLMFCTSQALGDASPSATEYDWGQVRKHLYGLKTMYRFAGRQKFIELDPTVMNRLSKLEDEINTRLALAYEQTETYNRQELEHWHKKYELAKEANI